MTEFSGRSGRRTIEQRRAEMLKRAKSAGSKYGIGGRKKEGHTAPKPVTLPKIVFPSTEEN